MKKINNEAKIYSNKKRPNRIKLIKKIDIKENNLPFYNNAYNDCPSTNTISNHYIN